jgi:DNA-binding response OmpR family regulator
MPKGLGESARNQGPLQAPRALRILIADDDRDSVLTLTMLLREEGHEVRGALTGKHALRVASEFDPDVAILDIQLPELSGWEVARAIRARRGNDRPMVIGISGEYKLGSDRILSTIIGFDHYLLKPYDVKMLFDLIEPLRLPPAGA